MKEYTLKLPLEVSSEGNDPRTFKMLFRIEAETPFKALQQFRKNIAAAATKRPKPNDAPAYAELLEAVRALECATSGEVADHLGYSKRRTYHWMQKALANHHVKKHVIKHAHPQYTLAPRGVSWLKKER